MVAALNTQYDPRYPEGMPGKYPPFPLEECVWDTNVVGDLYQSFNIDFTLENVFYSISDGSVLNTEWKNMKNCNPADYYYSVVEDTIFYRKKIGALWDEYVQLYKLSSNNDMLELFFLDGAVLFVNQYLHFRFVRVNKSEVHHEKE